jgi:hypothetical protein
MKRKEVILKKGSVGLLVLVLLGWSVAAQSSLTEQFKNNLATVVTKATLQSSLFNITVTKKGVAFAVRSTATETLWLTELENVEPIKVEVQGTQEQPQVEIRLEGQNQLLVVDRRFEHFVVLREPRGRQITPVLSGASVRVGDAVTILTFGAQGPSAQEATVTQLDAARGLFAVSVLLDREFDQWASTHGAPIFIVRDGQVRLVGLYVGHERAKAYNDKGWGAGALLPDLEQLLKERTRVLNLSEYRLIQGFTGDRELELHNVQEPRDAKNVKVTVQARINFAPRTIEAVLDIQSGRGSKTIPLGRSSDQIEVQQVIIRY